jgi:hypothetical protein
MVVDESWRTDLERWLAPFLAGLSHQARRRMCPQYIAGLIGPGDRKSVQPMAARGGEAGYDQLHHFVAAGIWDSAPLEAALLKEADRLVGGTGAFLVIDDTAMPKKDRYSVGVAPQYASSLGKNANCQTLVSVTLASGEVPVMVGLRLFLPESWTSEPERMAKAKVRADRQVALTGSIRLPRQNRSGRSPAIGPTRPRSSITSAAPCRLPRRSRLPTCRSMGWSPICYPSTESFGPTQGWTRPACQR